MSKEKPRMVEHWEVKHSIFLGGHEIVFAEDESHMKNQYFVGDCNYDNPFGIAEYTNCIGTADYLEAISDYAQRLQTQAELVRQERSERSISDEPLTQDACLSGGLGEDITGKLVVIRPNVMHRDRRTADYQYFLLTAVTAAALMRSDELYSGRIYIPGSVRDGSGTISSESQIRRSCLNGLMSV